MKKHQLHISSAIKPYLEAREISAAMIMAQYFRSDVTFIKRNSHAKTADFKIGGVVWEVKSPVGDGKRTVQNNLRSAEEQSPNIVMDLRRCKMHIRKAESRIRYELARAHKIKRLIIISKTGKVIEVK